MNPKRVLDEAARTLEAGGVESARNDAEILLSQDAVTGDIPAENNPGRARQ